MDFGELWGAEALVVGLPLCTCALSSWGLRATSTHRIGQRHSRLPCLRNLPYRSPEPFSSGLVLLDLCPRSELYPEQTGLFCTQPQMGSAVTNPHVQGGSGLCSRQARRQVPASRTHEGVLIKGQDQLGWIRWASSEMMPRPGLEVSAGVG